MEDVTTVSLRLPNEFRRHYRRRLPETPGVDRVVRLLLAATALLLAVAALLLGTPAAP